MGDCDWQCVRRYGKIPRVHVYWHCEYVNSNTTIFTCISYSYTNCTFYQWTVGWTIRRSDRVAIISYAGLIYRLGVIAAKQSSIRWIYSCGFSIMNDEILLLVIITGHYYWSIHRVHFQHSTIDENNYFLSIFPNAVNMCWYIFNCYKFIFNRVGWVFS